MFSFAGQLLESQIMGHYCIFAFSAASVGHFLQAYIDPGSGSYIFQLLIAGVTGVFFFLVAAKRKIVGFFKKEEPPSTSSDAAPKEAVASHSKPDSKE